MKKMLETGLFYRKNKRRDRLCLSLRFLLQVTNKSPSGQKC